MDIKEKPKTKWLGQEFEYLDSVDSTNDFAYIRAEDGVKEGFVIAAGTQMQGRGRKNREWDSPMEDGLWFSLVLRPKMEPKEATALTLVTAVGICRGLDYYSGLGFGIKWPNDILIENRKLCGILSEMKAEPKKLHYVVIGIGLNLRTTGMVPELQNIAIGMEEVLTASVNREEVFCHLLEGLESAYDQFYAGEFDALKAEWEERSVMLGKTVSVDTNGETIQGTVLGISNEGFLRIRLDNGKVAHVISGDVKLEA